MTPRRARHLEASCHILLAVAAAAGAGWLLMHNPMRYVQLIAEDHLGENFTALAQLAAGIAFLLAAIRSTRGAARGIAALLAAACLFVGLEEMSWGQRLLNFQTPRAMAQFNQQGEATLHNVVEVSRWYGLLGAMLLVWLVVSALPPSRRRGWDRAGLPTAGVAAWPWALWAAWLCLLPDRTVKAEELAELAVSVLFTAMAVGAWLGPGPDRSMRRLGVTLALLASCAIGARAMLALRDPPLGWRMAQTAQDCQRQGLTDQALRLYAIIERTPGWRTADSALNQAMLLLQVGQDDHARQVLRRELEIVRQEPDSLDLLRRRASMHHLLGEAAEAQTLTARLQSRVETLLRDEADPDERARGVGQLARAAYERGDRSEALRLARQARGLARSALQREVFEQWARRYLDQRLEE